MTHHRESETPLRIGGGTGLAGREGDEEMAPSFYPSDRAVATPDRWGEYSPLAAGQISEIDLATEYGQGLLLLAAVHALCRDGLSDDEIVERVGRFGFGRTGGPVAAEPQVALALSTAREQRAAAYAASRHFKPAPARARRREMLTDVHQLLNAGWTADAIAAVAAIPSAFGIQASEFLTELRNVLSAAELEEYVRYVVFLAERHRAERNLQLRSEAWYTQANWDDWRRPNSLRLWHAGLLMLQGLGDTRQFVAGVRQMALLAGIGTAGDGNATNAEHRASQNLVERGAVERHSIARDEAKQRALDPMQARTILQLHPAGDWLRDRLGSVAGGSLTHKLTDPRGVSDITTVVSGHVDANNNSDVAWPPFLWSLLHPLFGYVALGMLSGAIWHVLGIEGELPAVEVAGLLGADVKVVRRRLSELAEHGLAERDGKLWVPGPASPDEVAASMPVLVPTEHFVADRPRLQAESAKRSRDEYREVVARGALGSGGDTAAVTVASIAGEQSEPLALPQRAGGPELLTEDEIRTRIAASAAAMDEERVA